MIFNNLGRCIKIQNRCSYIREKCQLYKNVEISEVRFYSFKMYSE